MLVLTRRVGEVIVIGDGIKITVVDICGLRVKLGIVADESIPVHRGEIWEKIKEVREPE